MFGPRIEAAVGVLPSAALGFGPSIGLHFDGLQTELSLGYFPERSAPLEEDPSVGGDVTLLQGELSLRYAVRLDEVEIGPQLAVQLGAISGSAYGVSAPGDATGVWLCPLFDVAAAWRLTRYLAVPMGLGAGVPVFRHSFVIEPYGLVHRPGPVIGRLWLGIQLRQ